MVRGVGELRLSGQSVRMRDVDTGVEYIDWPPDTPELEVGAIYHFPKSTGVYPVEVVEIINARSWVVRFTQGWEA